MRCERQSIDSVRMGVNQTNRNTVIEYLRCEWAPQLWSPSVCVRALCVYRWKFLCTQRIMHAGRFRDVLLPLYVVRYPHIKLMPPKYHRITGTTFQSTRFGYSCSCLYNFSYYYYHFTPIPATARCWMHWAAHTVTDINIVMNFICYSLPHRLRTSMRKIMNGIPIDSGLLSGDPLVYSLNWVSSW